MRSGSLDRQIDLLSRGSSQSATGAASSDWSVYASEVWAEKRDRSNDQGREDDQAVASRVSTFRVYFRTDVKTDHRVRYPAGEAGTLYAITGIEEIGRREGLLITARAEVAS
ncbi:MAG: head-tail adaptor protein [Oceanicaulis sp.]